MTVENRRTSSDFQSILSYTFSDKQKRNMNTAFPKYTKTSLCVLSHNINNINNIKSNKPYLIFGNMKKNFAEKVPFEPRDLHLRNPKKNYCLGKQDFSISPLRPKSFFKDPFPQARRCDPRRIINQGRKYP